MTRRYLLDTNIVSEVIKPDPDRRILAWLGRQLDEHLYLATIVLGEVWRGIAERQDGARKRLLLSWFDSDRGPKRLFAGRILPLDEAAAMQWAEFIADGHREGRPRSVVDMQIAAIALVNGCTLVTRNLAHFAPVQAELAILDPSA